jgi:hypothetical protein
VGLYAILSKTAVIASHLFSGACRPRIVLEKQSKPTALAYRFYEYLADVLRARLA